MALTMKAASQSVDTATAELQKAQDGLAQFEQEHREAASKADALRGEKETLLASGTAKGDTIARLNSKIADADAEAAAHAETVEMQRGIVQAAQDRLAAAEDAADEARRAHYGKAAEAKRQELVETAGSLLADLIDVETKGGALTSAYHKLTEQDLLADIRAKAESLGAP
jgi:chromosome segregation ATPase